MTRSMRVRTHDDGQDRWHMVDAAPDRRLGGLIQNYGWWAEQTATFDTRRELAGTSGTLIVNLASGLELVDASGGHHRLGAGEGFIAGASQATSLSRSGGAMAGVHVRAPLTMLARIAGVPVAELTNRVVPLTDLPGTKHSRIGERLLDLDDREQCWDMLDGFVMERMAAREAEDSGLDMLLARLAQGVRVQTLADGLGWSRKRLASRFRDATGMEPRAYAGLARFERFTGLLQAEPDIALAEVAVAAGYADQPHLTREVARFADTTPAELRRRLLPAGGGVRD